MGDLEPVRTKRPKLSFYTRVPFHISSFCRRLLSGACHEENEMSTCHVSFLFVCSFFLFVCSLGLLMSRKRVDAYLLTQSTIWPSRACVSVTINTCIRRDFFFFKSQKTSTKQTKKM